MSTPARYGRACSERNDTAKLKLNPKPHAGQPRLATPVQPTAPRPAWGLQLRSPYTANAPAQSWLGGQAVVPRGFIWPRGEDGKPLHFAAQIDLQTLRLPDAPSADHAPLPLPAQGCLLAFLGATLVLSPTEMQGAVSMPPPDDTPPLKDMGYFIDGTAFHYWPVDPVPFISKPRPFDDDFNPAPAVFPDRAAPPEAWITTMGVAALDAEAVLSAVTSTLSEATEFFKTTKRPRATPPPVNTQKVLETKARYYGWAMTHFIDALPRLRTWYEHAHAAPPDAPVDTAGLASNLHMRRALNAQITQNMSNIKTILSGEREAVMTAISYNTPQLSRYADYGALPPCYHDFINGEVMRWRGHRLFGYEPDFLNNHEDLSGLSPVISLAADSCIGTMSEHDYGFSNWHSDHDIAAGQWGLSTFIRHSSG